MAEFMVSNEDSLWYNITLHVLFESRPVVFPSGMLGREETWHPGAVKFIQNRYTEGEGMLDEELLFVMY